MPRSCLLRRLPLALAALAGPLAGPLAAGAQSSRSALATGAFAITNVSVIPMTADTVIADATVLVRDGRIAAVGPAASVRLPAGTRTVDGRGRFLVPGLADMHAHLYSDGAAPDSAAPDELGVMLANGVTAVRLMMGTPEQLALREAVLAGRTLGPQLWLASPQLTGDAGENAYLVRTPDEARDAVRRAVAARYDFVKLTTNVPPEVYDAIVAEAARQRIRVVGHVDTRVGLARALAAGQQIEHLDAYFEALLVDSLQGRESVSNYGLFRAASWATVDHVDDAKIARLAGATARAGVWSTPTLTVFNGFGRRTTDDELRRRPDWDLVPPAVRALYLRARTQYWGPNAAAVRTPERLARYVEVRNRLTKAIHDSSGRILAGSDTPEWLMVYGFTLHRELEHLVAAGLTPWQALAAATRTPAEFLGASAEWGTIAVGRRADLVLLAADPLADIRHTTRIEGVAIGGRWLERAALDAMLARASRSLDGRAPDSLRAGGQASQRTRAKGKSTPRAWPRTVPSMRATTESAPTRR